MKIFKKILTWTGIFILVIAACGFALYFIYVAPVLNKMEQTSVIPFDDNVIIVLGGGGNSGILVSDSLVVVVDTKMGDAAESFSKTVKKVAGNKPILVVNTHYHPDHSEGNKYYRGQKIVAGGNYTKEIWLKNSSEETMPTDWLKDRMDIKMGNDTITLLNMYKNAHTESDVFVYSHKWKILFGGDVILNGQVPAVMGGVADPDAYVEAFDFVQRQFNIQTIVPGHGPMGGQEILSTFRQFFADMKTAANDESKKSEMISKYKNWTQVPLLMSPENTIGLIKKKESTK